MSRFAPYPTITPIQEEPTKIFRLEKDYVADFNLCAKKWEKHIVNAINEEKSEGRLSDYDHATSNEFQNMKIPAGFEFDGASIPEFVESFGFLLFFKYKQGDTRLMAASLVHDWLYCAQTYCKNATDDLFFYMLMETDTSWQQAWRMWNAVRWYGRDHWTITKKDEEDMKALYLKISADDTREVDDYDFSKYLHPDNGYALWTDLIKRKEAALEQQE